MLIGANIFTRKYLVAGCVGIVLLAFVLLVYSGKPISQADVLLHQLSTSETTTGQSLQTRLHELARLQKRRPQINFYLHNKVAQPARQVSRYKQHGLRVRDNPPLMLQPPVNWGDNPNNDANWLFQKNALYVLTPVIQLHQASGDKASLELAGRLLEDWADYNLQQRQDNEYRWYDMAAGLRAVLYAYVIDAELRSDTPDYSRLSNLLKAAVAHAERLAEPADLAIGNHAYFQLAGLAAICEAVPALRSCPGYASYVQNNFNRLVKRQFSVEGVHREHAPGYHFFSMRRLSSLLATGWFHLDEDSTQRLDMASHVLPWFIHPDGSMAMIGDTDRQPGTLRSFVKSQAQGWTAGQDVGVSFPQSGYAMLRAASGDRRSAAGSYLILWAGDEQPGDPHERGYGHSHADNLTFEWSGTGVPVLVDAGKYSYDGDAWRSYFQSTRAHNTIEVDAEDFDNASSPGILPGIQSVGSVNELKHIHAAVAYRELELTHDRLLVLSPGEWLAVVDRLSGESTRTFTQWFHFEEQWQISAERDHYVGRRGDVLMSVQSLGATAPVGRLIKGAISPRIQGWISPGYKEKIPNYALGFAKSGRRTIFVTIFRWATSESISDAHFKSTSSSLVVCWHDDFKKDGFDFDGQIANRVEC